MPFQKSLPLLGAQTDPLIGSDVVALSVDSQSATAKKATLDQLAVFIGAGAPNAALVAIGALTPAANNGILFTGPTAAALFPLASGPWTPALSLTVPGTSSFAYSTQYGYYQRTKDYIYLDFALGFTPTVGTGSGALIVGGSPLSAVNANATLAASGVVSTMGGSFVGISGSLSVSLSSASALRFTYTPAASSTSQFAATNLTNAAAHAISGSIAFRVA